MEELELKKPIKVLSSTALASVLAATTLVPVVSAEAPQDVPADAKILADVLVEVDGKVLSLDLRTYQSALSQNYVSSKQIKYVRAKEGSTYPLRAYQSARGQTNSIPEALEYLYLKGFQVDLKDIPNGIVEDGKIIPDEQPEDRLNETFFYNAA